MRSRSRTATTARAGRLRRGGVAAAIAAAGLLIATSSSATATALLGSKHIAAKAIGTQHLKNQAVKTTQVGDRAIGGKKIKIGAIKPDHLSPKAQHMLAGQKGADGADGADGRDGVDGIDGANGRDGVNGVSGYQLVSSSPVVIQPRSGKLLRATCPAGKRAIGGGVKRITGPTNAPVTVFAVVTDNGLQWRTRVVNSSAKAPITMQPQAVCVLAR